MKGKDRAWPGQAVAGDLVGARVRVVTRRGYVVDGICVDVWPLAHGGLAVKIKPADGSALREVTTTQPVTVIGRRAASE